MGHGATASQNQGGAGAPPGHGIPPFTQSGIHPDTVIRFYVYVLVLYDKNPNLLFHFPLCYLISSIQ